MNILIIGKPIQNLFNTIRSSKHLDKLYTATFEPLDNIPNIEFESFDELIQKSKALKIDIAITADKELIAKDIAGFFKKNRINIIAANKKWFNLEASRMITKKLLSHYSINTPKVIKAPLSFPVIIKTDQPMCTYVAKSMQDLVNKMEELNGEKTFLEEFLDGERYELLTLWDGQNLLDFPPKNLTEVQEDRLNLYKTKLNFMLSDEKADFTGFFISKLIWAKNDWYVLEYKMRLDKSTNLCKTKPDFLYILNSAIYQKLNEI